MLRKNSRKMKGGYAPLTDFVGAILFAGAVVALILFVQSAMLKFSVDMNVAEGSMRAVDAAHIMEDCFSGGGGSISASLVGKKRICEDCGICGVSAGARLEYLEGPEKGTAVYDKNYAENAATHKIFVTVSKDGKDYVSRLSVSVSGKAAGTTAAGGVIT